MDDKRKRKANEDDKVDVDDKRKRKANEDDEEVRCAYCDALADHFFDGWHCEQGCF